jgi:digeranylgeranylglycerophospholipid reductase
VLRDVAVVGAGPAGLLAAERLAARGLDVVVVEAQPRIGEGAICSGVIGEEAFAQFGLPSGPVRTKIFSIQAVSPQGKILEHRPGVPLARVVDKEAFNRALGGRTRAAGAEIETGRRVESIERERSCVVLRLRSSEGQGGTLRARVAVIASGVNGSLSKLLNLARPRQLLRAMQCEIAAPQEDQMAPTRVYVGASVAPGAFGWRIPLGGGKVRVGIMTIDDPRPYWAALLRRIQPGLGERDLKVSRKPIAQAPVGRSVGDRLLAVGEAAGHVKTSTGGGIYYGLLSAELASEVLLRAFETGRFTAASLGTFERYWRAAFGKELLIGYLCRELASHFSDKIIEGIFDLVNSGKILSRLNGQLKFDWHRRALLTTLRSLMLYGGGEGLA